MSETEVLVSWCVEVTCILQLMFRTSYSYLDLQPRTIEVERLLGVDKDVLENGIAWSIIKLYDTADPYRVVKSWPIAEQVDPTPSFPIVSKISAQLLKIAR